MTITYIFNRIVQKKEQDEHRKLVNEKQERKDKGEKNLHIRHGKVVCLDQPFRQSPQLLLDEPEEDLGMESGKDTCVVLGEDTRDKY